MGVCRIAMCHDCGCYVDLDKMERCWESDFWWHETYDTRLVDCQELRKDQLIYKLVYAQVLCRFYNIHWGHNVKIYSDGVDTDEAYFNALYIGGEVENGKALKEVSIDELGINVCANR